MKRLSYLLLFACAGLWLILAACGGEGPAVERSVTTIENSQSGEVLAAGMDRETIEQVLGNVEDTIEFESEEDDTVTVTYFETETDQVQVQYGDSKAILISVGGRMNQKDQDSSDWFINGISLGSTRDEVLDAYGTPSEEGVLGSPDENGDITTVITYCYDEEDAIVENSGDAKYTVNFILKNDSVINFALFYAD